MNLLNDYKFTNNDININLRYEYSILFFKKRVIIKLEN